MVVVKWFVLKCDKKAPDFERIVNNVLSLEIVLVTALESKDAACTCPLWTSWSPLPIVVEVSPTSEVGTPMRRSYVVRMRWMVIYGYGVPGGALNLNSTNYPDRGHNGNPPLQRKIPMVEPGIESGTS
jgi:hypothetical protein